MPGPDCACLRRKPLLMMLPMLPSAVPWKRKTVLWSVCLARRRSKARRSVGLRMYCARTSCTAGWRSASAFLMQARWRKPAASSPGTGCFAQKSSHRITELDARHAASPRICVLSAGSGACCSACAPSACRAAFLFLRSHASSCSSAALNALALPVVLALRALSASRSDLNRAMMSARSVASALRPKLGRTAQCTDVVTFNPSSSFRPDSACFFFLAICVRGALQTAQLEVRVPWLTRVHFRQVHGETTLLDPDKFTSCASFAWCEFWAAADSAHCALVVFATAHISQARASPLQLMNVQALHSHEPSIGASHFRRFSAR
mmetsp:Transcript_39351/g.93084  ORF Transcript_39351/g.93084 Transcript_39351/m.93084 type:complete len:320 (-) Transcript_39351:263-1222(-)